MNNKNINYLFIMRIWAAAILVACCYWLFSDIELEYGPKIYLPLIYFYSTELYITKKMTVLIVPILMNIALWIPCYWSYIFIRLVLYAERIATIIWIAFFIVFGGLGMAFMAQGSIADFIFVSAICMALNEVLYRNFITDKYKEKFSAASKAEEEIIYLTSQLVMAFYLIILVLLMGEYVVQRHITENLQVDYLQVATHNSIKLVKENTVEEIPYYKGWRTKLSRDEKMLLVKNWSYKEEGEDKNLFVVDLASMETINILAGSNTIKKKFIYNDYEFTPDSKYVVVGNRILDNPKIKFAVLDVATGKADTRFSDPQGLLEDLTDDIAEVPLIRFNPSGDYFVVISRVEYQDYRLEFWDYQRGNLICVETIKGDLRDLVWISDRKCIVLYQHEDTSTQEYAKSIEQLEILVDNTILTTTKVGIINDNISKIIEMLGTRIININSTGEYLSMLDTFYDRNILKNTIKIWDLNSEKLIFSLNSDNKISAIVFHPDGKQLILFEGLKDEKVIITFWDIATGEKKESLFVSLPTKRISNIILVNKYNKVILINGAVNIISLDTAKYKRE